MTKTNNALFATTTLTAGSATQTGSATVTFTAAYGGEVLVKLTNGGTGPGTAASVQLQHSNNNGTKWYDFGPLLIGDTAASGVRSWSIPIDIGAMYLRVLAGGNTSQPVVVDVDCSVVTV